jgi:cycloeucalenol cycloisomerase
MVEAHDILLLKVATYPVIAILLFSLGYYIHAISNPTIRSSIEKYTGQTWLSLNPEKRWTEKIFLQYSVFWISWFGCVVVSGVWEYFKHVEYLVVCGSLAWPCFVVPWYFSKRHPELFGKKENIYDTYWFRANLWIAIISYVGNYFWTHYFYQLLGASYTFQSWRINDVPIPMFFATHAYFLTYHTATTCILRRYWTSSLYNLVLPRWLQLLSTWSLVLTLSWTTAFLEAFTIQGFPYYEIKDRMYLYTVGSIVYGIYFIVSFPAFTRIDEERVEGSKEGGSSFSSSSSSSSTPAKSNRSKSPGKKVQKPTVLSSESFVQWTLSQTAIDSLGACMLVTILLDLWKLSYPALRLYF